MNCLSKYLCCLIEYGHTIVDFLPDRINSDLRDRYSICEEQSSAYSFRDINDTNAEGSRWIFSQIKIRQKKMSLLHDFMTEMFRPLADSWSASSGVDGAGKDVYRQFLIVMS